jgi:hypothetical protein
MKNSAILFLCFILLNVPYYFSQACNVQQVVTTNQTQLLQNVYQQIQSDFQNEDYTNIYQENQEIINVLGTQAGIPEVIENYSSISNSTEWLSIESSLNLSRSFISMDSLIYIDLWKLAKGLKPPNYLPHSLPLRSAAEMAVGLLKIAEKETNVNRKNAYTSWANKTLDSLQSMQLSSGAFPFPDLRTYNDPVFTPIIQNYLNSLGTDSVNVLQNGWIIDDNNSGEFKFDAGVIANAFYEAYQLTGNNSYKTTCLSIADYLMTLKLNLNYNYNSFVSLGLTRAYQITNNSDYLNRAILNVQYGILPGQTENGRWADGHNAKSIYHNIIIKNTTPLLKILPINHIFFNELKDSEVKAIRNMINYYDLCGVVSGFEWLVSSKRDLVEILPNSLNDSIDNFIGRYIQQANIDFRFLNLESLGMYFELFNQTNNLLEQNFLRDFVKIYPNPVINNITIKSQKNITQINLFSSIGEKIKINPIFLSKNEVEIQLEHLQGNKNKGIYFLELIVDQEKRVFKILK